MDYIFWGLIAVACLFLFYAIKQAYDARGNCEDEEGVIF